MTQKPINEDGIYTGREVKWRVSDVAAEMQDMGIPEPYNREDLENILVATFEDNDALVEAIAQHIRSTISYKLTMQIPKTIKTKDFGDITVDQDAEWGRLSPYEDVGFPAGEHLYCFVYVRHESLLGYYITTAYGSQRQLETGKL
jgi:hypothetical protein